MITRTPIGFMLEPGGILPTQGREHGDAGYDLHAHTLRVFHRDLNNWSESLLAKCGGVPIPAGGSRVFGVGVRVAMPLGVRGRVCSRSGLAMKHDVEAGAGLVDPNFTGVIGVKLYNHGFKPFTVHDGDRIAQICFEGYLLAEWQGLEAMPDTARGECWAGSTGVAGRPNVLPE